MVRQEGPCWEPICAHCGKLVSYDRRWQEGEPVDQPAHNRDCCEAVCSGGAAPLAKWEFTLVRRVVVGRMSGFSTSESDFTPHFNTAFGKPVHSLSEMKHLQAKGDVCDSVVKGDGADRLAPRDLATRFKHHREVREAIDSGKPLEPMRGVKVEYRDADA